MDYALIDVPSLLVTVMEQQPWMKRNKNGTVFVYVHYMCIGYHGNILLLGKLLKYIDGKWREVAVGDKLQLTKTEAQVTDISSTCSL